MIDYSNILFERLGCRDYARFDFRADAEGEIRLLEVNPNPGWCWDGKMNIMAGFQGMRYSELLGQILLAAVERHRDPDVHDAVIDDVGSVDRGVDDRELPESNRRGANHERQERETAPVLLLEVALQLFAHLHDFGHVDSMHCGHMRRGAL